MSDANLWKQAARRGGNPRDRAWVKSLGAPDEALAWSLGQGDSRSVRSPSAKTPRLAIGRLDLSTLPRTLIRDRPDIGHLRGSRQVDVAAGHPRRSFPVLAMLQTRHGFAATRRRGSRTRHCLDFAP
jgi:hypothetical protein